MSKITKDQAKDLHNAFQCWQQDYDPVEDKEQYDMFGLGIVAMDALLASLEAEPIYQLWDEGYYDTEKETYDAVLKAGGRGRIVYTAPPAPVVPDMKELVEILDWILMLPCPTPKATLMAKRLAVVIDTCRDAMLQGADGNAPVISDGWVACSERMPENDDFVYIWPRPDFGVELHVAQYGKFDKRDAGWYAQVYEQNYGIEYYPVKVTHWMPLPATPNSGD